MIKEYRTIGEVVGPLMAVEKLLVKYEELIEVRMQNGEIVDKYWKSKKIKQWSKYSKEQVVSIYVTLLCTILGHPLELGVSKT